MLDYPLHAVDAIVAIAAFPLTVAVLWVLLRSPAGGRLVAVPSDERWHEQPTPTFGGVGIFSGFIGGVLLALAVGAVEWSGELGGILAGVTLVFAAGLVDDLRHLSPIAKLAAQIAAAVIVITSGIDCTFAVQTSVSDWPSPSLATTVSAHWRVRPVAFEGAVHTGFWAEALLKEPVPSPPAHAASTSSSAVATWCTSRDTRPVH